MLKPRTQFFINIEKYIKLTVPVSDTYTSSRVSVSMIFITISEAGESGQRLKEIEFNKSSS